MKKVLFVLVVSALIMSVSSAYATDTWSYNLTPQHVRVQGDRNQVSFEVESGSYINPASCGITVPYEIIAEDNSDQMLSILLAAYMAGKKIDILVHGVTGECSHYNRPRVSQIR